MYNTIYTEKEDSAFESYARKVSPEKFNKYPGTGIATGGKSTGWGRGEGYGFTPCSLLQFQNVNSKNSLCLLVLVKEMKHLGKK